MSPRPLRSSFAFVGFAFALAVSAVARPAHAEPVAPELLDKLATFALTFDAEKKRASYDLSGKLEVLDGDNKVTETKELAAHVDSTGAEPKITVVKYTEDGVDKTADAVKDERESEEKRKKKRDSGKELKMPIVAAQQGRYSFDATEYSADGSRVRIQFTPKSPADDTVEGAAWVDVAAGTVLSASFRLSKTPMFIHYLHFTVEFNAATSLGPAVSKITVDGEGGILFLRRHFRGSANLSGYTIAP